MDIVSHNYSDNIKNKKILIFGPEIPPIGGVSVHIERVSQKYLRQNNQINIFDATHEIIGQSKLSYIVKIIKLIKSYKPDIVDYHTSFLKYYVQELFILVLLKNFSKFKINIIDHDPRYLYKQNYIQKKILNFLLKFINSQIIIGSKTYESYIDNKILLNNFSIQSAFLSPVNFNIEDLMGSYPKNFLEFLDSKETIILSNAFSINFVDNKDLYGIDKTIELLNYLNQNNKNLGLILLYQNCESNYFNKIKLKIKKLNLENNIFMLQGKYLLWPLFLNKKTKSKIFIRPTLSDGYSVSIEESLYFNVPVVASDVCQRPKGTILFNVNDQSDFNIKVDNVLKGLSNERNFN